MTTNNPRKPRAKNGEANTTKVLCDLGLEAYEAVRKLATGSDLPMSSVVRILVRHTLRFNGHITTYDTYSNISPTHIWPTQIVSNPHCNEKAWGHESLGDAVNQSFRGISPLDLGKHTAPTGTEEVA